MIDSKLLDWGKGDGLLPAVVQHADSGAVLMLGYMNREALAETLSSNRVTFWSRSKKRLWTKGETSGNRLKVVSALADCDFDTILCRVEVEGKGVVCHTGARTCFNTELAVAGGAR